ncbi:MAG TPA: lactate utilization protein [Acidimicrobiia bacterium]|nr:lactate utilization protein [Acidimicrobiia bacterium]
MERDAFISRVGLATFTSVLPAPPPVLPELPDLPAADLVALFRARAQTVNSVVHGPVSRHGAPRVVAGIAAGHEASKFMSWDDLPVAGVASALNAAGLSRVDHELGDDRLGHNLGYLDLDVGVTGSDGALAESGSLILRHGEGRPRMASLIPEIHIVLLDVDGIHRSLAHWAREYPDFAGETTNLVLVTGPSRTADIEQQLNLGVHGPRHLHVVLIR